jgi:DNA-binding transcriptional LysR family regulator
LDNRLNHVVAVARAGSFTGAAIAVGVTQSAITRSIADLERQIGYSIFLRTSRGAILTEQGRDFADRAQKLIDDTKDLLRRPHADEDPYAGILRVGVCPASMEFMLIEPIARLLKKHPPIRLDVNGSTFERIVQQLRTGSIDVAVGFDAAFSDWPDLRRFDIPNYHAGSLFVRREHPLLKLRKITPRALAQYDFVSASDSRPYGTIIRALYEDQGVDWRKHIHVVDFFPLVRKIVATTNGIGVTMTPKANQSQAFKNLFVTLDSIKMFAEPSPMCCAVRSRWDLRPAVKALISVLQARRSRIEV